mgnify:FL=1
MPASPHPIELTIVVANGLMRFLRTRLAIPRPIQVFLRPFWLKLQPLCVNLQLHLVHTIALAIALSEWLQRSISISTGNEGQSFGARPLPRNVHLENVQTSDTSPSCQQNSFDHEGELNFYNPDEATASSAEHLESKPFFLNLEIKRRGRTMIVIKS